MNTRIIVRSATWLLIGSLAGPLAVSAAEPADPSAKRDRATYNQLARQVRVAKSKLELAKKKGLEQAHRNDGRVDDALKAEILALRDEIERKTNRLELVALRHGWEMPDFANVKPHAKHGSETRAEVFGAADRMIMAALDEEAQHIAANVYLPVVSRAAVDAED